MRLLAVDDDPVVLDLLTVVFGQEDLPGITCAQSAGQALTLLEEDEAGFDCLILDIEMPGMNGIELCRKIRRLPAYHDTPIVMLTSVRERIEIESAFGAGATDYVTKPFDVKEIITRIRVAKRMSETTERAPRLDPLSPAPDAEAGVHDFEITCPVRLNQQEQLILPFSLGNYLSQLSRQALDQCCVFAIRIEDIEKLYAECTTHEFAIALAEIVDAVVEVVDHPNLLMAYEGDGILLAISQGAEPPEWPLIEDRTHVLLNEGSAIFADGRPMDLRVSIGNPIPPYTNRNQRVKKTFDRAIDRARMRSRSNAAQRQKSGKGSPVGMF
ncbi:Heme response regulator HssR [Sulfitobacter sp. THAF37]|uniref:response regulator n=1 Tax=Sulfitobacter sp. THAF37 TaxID=2587855 RepID=UPI001268CEAF|nr:response regulator [Sulfitobacter sp. THAF37]QFT59320.1 Heme response regulator HssR [Sulfitobacter sp. THAF37]